MLIKKWLWWWYDNYYVRCIGVRHENTWFCCMGTTKEQTSLHFQSSVQSGQHLFCSLFWKFNKAKFLSSLCSWAGLFESYKVGNPKDRFSNKEALLFHVKDTSCSNKRWDKPLIKFVNNLQIHVTGSPHLFINQIKSFMCNKLVQVTVVFLKKNCQLD